ncbi:MAG TPA: hypothetical protein VMF69_00485 [Gemmataceae bacterium]|nr:hypothetical protein [Gemmataceae bacterium]
MARTLKGTLTLCLALGLTSIALGQDRQQPREPSPLGLLGIPDVQKELKMSEEQIGKLKDALGKMREKYKEDEAKFRQMSPEEQQKKIKAISEDHNKAIASVLDAKQWKRYKQIQWQLSGMGALQDPELQKELKLSDEQKKKIGGLFDDGVKKIQDLYKNRDESPQKQEEKYASIIKDVEKRVNDVLSEAQQKNLKELKGPEFRLSSPSTPPKGGR